MLFHCGGLSTEGWGIFPDLETATIMFYLEEPIVRVAKWTHLLLDCCLLWWSFQDSTLHCADWALAAEMALNLDRQCCISDGARHQSLWQSVSLLTVPRVWALISRHHTGRDPVPTGDCMLQAVNSTQVWHAAGLGFCDTRQEHRELVCEALNTNFAKTFISSTYILLF